MVNSFTHDYYGYKYPEAATIVHYRPAPLALKLLILLKQPYLGASHAKHSTHL